MNPRERIISALLLEEPDRVPMFELGINGFVMEKVLGRPCFRGMCWGVEADPELDREKAIEKQIRDHIDCYKKLKLDMLSVFPAAPRGWKDEKKWINKKKGEFFVIDEFCTTYRYVPESDQPFVYDVPIKSPEDVDNYEMPDPLAEGRTDYAERAKKIVREEMAISCWLPGIVEFTWTRLTGLERFVIYLYRYPSRMERLLDKMSKYVIELGKAMIDAGVEVIWFGNDTAGKNGPIISPALHRKFIIPRLAQIVAAMKKKGSIVINHTDGNIYPILDDLVSTGIDALHSIEPQAGMNLKVVKEKYGEKICLLGNVDVSHTLPFGKPEDVANEVRECIKAAAPGGGYVLASSNTLVKGMPLENIYTMYETGLKYGKYPLAKI